jgi:hypothetical protein
VTAYRIRMQAICQIAQAGAVADYLQVIPGFYAIGKPRTVDGKQARLDFSIVVREEVQEGSLLHTAEERVGQYLWQRPDVQPVVVEAIGHERLSEEEAERLPPEHIPPRRAL